MAVLTIESFLEAIANGIGAIIPGLAVCEVYEGCFDLDELQRVAMRTPAVFIGWLGGSSGNPQGCVIDVELALIAYIITSDKIDSRRGPAARSIVETLLRKIPGQQWGLTADAAPAADLTMENLYNGKLGNKGVAMWAVDWRQKVRLAADCT